MSAIQIVKAQDQPDFETFTEQIMESLDPDVNHNALLEHLTGLHRRPIDLNKADFDDLNSLGFLTAHQITAIIEHRTQFGAFIDAIELRRCPLSQQEIRWLKLFTFVRQPLSSTIAHGNRHNIILTQRSKWPRPQGFAQNYPGNNHQYILRYRGQWSPLIRVGFTAEKDAGEAFFRSSNKQGFDFYSGHVEIQDIGPFTEIILGDFQTDFGQGMTIGSGLRSGKSSLVLQTSRIGRGFSPYRSIDENNFMRGLGCTVNQNNIGISFFASQLRKDANTDSATRSFSSFQTTGLHRTASELEDENAVRVRQAGLHLEHTTSKTSLGYTLVQTGYNRSFLPDSSAYRLFHFRGKQYIKHGLNYRMLLKGTLLFGEVCYASNHAYGISLSSLYSLGRKLDLSLLYRFYSPGFIGFESSVFSERSSAGNEQGLYIGLQTKITPVLTLAAYTDIYSSPWLRYGLNVPSRGFDCFSELRYSPSKRLEVYIRYRSEIQDDIGLGPDVQKELIAKRLSSFRLHLTNQLSKELRLQIRMETNQYRATGPPSRANLIYFDFNYKPVARSWKMALRTTMTKVEQFENRIYSYENDVPNAYSIPFFQRNGLRNYVLISYRMNRYLSFWVRFAHDYSFGDDGFGSGIDHLNGPRRSDLKLQAKVRF